MSTERPTPASGTGSARRTATVVVSVMAGATAVLAIGLFLRENAPGNVGNGFLQGAAVGLVGAAVMILRVGRQRGSTFERAWTRTGDERDDALLTRSLAVVGLAAFPLISVAALSIAVGAYAPMVLTLLLAAVPVLLGATFAVLHRRG